MKPDPLHDALVAALGLCHERQRKPIIFRLGGDDWPTIAHASTQRTADSDAAEAMAALARARSLRVSINFALGDGTWSWRGRARFNAALAAANAELATGAWSFRIDGRRCALRLVAHEWQERGRAITRLVIGDNQDEAIEVYEVDDAPPPIAEPSDSQPEPPFGWVVRPFAKPFAVPIAGLAPAEPAPVAASAMDAARMQLRAEWPHHPAPDGLERGGSEREPLSLFALGFAIRPR